jgi:hypothetical protein
VDLTAPLCVNQPPTERKPTAVYDVGEAAFQAPHGFFVALPGGSFALVVAAARAVVPDLGECHDVQGVVELAVTCA